MRLNRVLLLAAVINLMIFAMIFTISCSGDDGKAGSAGADCIVDTRDDGAYIVTCGGVEAGIIEGGQGAQGPNGKPGAAGKDGDNCWLGEKVEGAYQVICGPNQNSGQVKGNLSSCDVRAVSQYEFSIKCSGKSINLCGSKAFEATKQYCDATSGEPKDVTLQECLGVREKYNPYTHYCGFASEDDADVNKHSVLLLCGKSTEPQPNVDDWNDEYCRFIGPKPEDARADDETCGAEKAKLNERGWQSQYCGYASLSATVKTVLTGACKVLNSDPLEYKGPNEEAFGRAYCAATKTGTELYYEDALCGTDGKPNEGKWKKEYCGFANKNNLIKKVYNDACDVPGGTESEPLWGAHAETFNGGYCKSNRYGVTTYTDEIWCGSYEGETAEAEKNGPDNRLNEGTWKGEYCGVDAAGADIKYAGACDVDEDDGTHVGPNSQGVGEGYCMFDRSIGKTFYSDTFCEEDSEDKKTMNEGSWKGQYCGYKDKDAKDQTLLTGACDILDDGVPVGPHSEGYREGYCVLASLVPYIGETTIPTLSLVAGKYTVYATVEDECSDGKIPNLEKWNYDYCGYKDAKTQENDSTNVITKGSGENAEACALLKPKSYSYDSYCTVDQFGNMTVTNEGCGATKKLNENKWQGQYCFQKDTETAAVGKCNGGQVPDLSQKAGTAAACLSKCGAVDPDLNYVGFTNECVDLKCGASTVPSYVDNGIDEGAYANQVCRCTLGYSSSVYGFTGCFVKGTNDSTHYMWPNVKAPAKRLDIGAGTGGVAKDVCHDGSFTETDDVKTGVLGTSGEAVNSCTCPSTHPYFYLDGGKGRCVKACDTGKGFTSTINATCKTCTANTTTGVCNP